MIEANNIIVTVEMSLEELGRISIALDRMWALVSAGEDHGVLDSHYGELQVKWDALYRSLHTVRGNGIVGWRVRDEL